MARRGRFDFGTGRRGPETDSSVRTGRGHEPPVWGKANAGDGAAVVNQGQGTMLVRHRPKRDCAVIGLLPVCV